MFSLAFRGLNIPYASLPKPGPLIVFGDFETQNVVRPHLPGGRRPWEVALCRREPDGEEFWFHGFVRLRDLPWDPTDPDLDRKGLDVGRFFSRHPEIVNPGGVHDNVYSEPKLAEIIRDWFQPMPGTTTKPIFAGIVPDFDEQISAQLLRTYRYITSEGLWHFELFDVMVAVAARLGVQQPWSHADLSRRIGVDPDAFDRHTARGDVEWTRALYDAVYKPLWRIVGRRSWHTLTRRRAVAA